MIFPYDETYKPQQRDDIVLIGGCFDVLHYGHVTFFKEAKELGKHLVIALESDNAIVASKNGANPDVSTSEVRTMMAT